MSSQALPNGNNARPRAAEGFWNYYFGLRFLCLGYQYWRAPVLIVFIISSVVAVLEKSEPVILLQAWSLDLFMGKAPKWPPFGDRLSDVYLVTIDDSDYRGIFQGHSPLAPKTIVQLTESVLSLRPTVVGIDLDTKDPDWYAYQNRCEVKGRVPSFLHQIYPIPVVWEQMAVEANDSSWHRSAEGPIQPYQILGGCKDYQQAPQGIPRFPVEADGVARLYRRAFPVPSGKLDKSFAREIAEEYASKLETSPQSPAHALGERYCTQLKKGAAEEEKILNFDQRSSFPRIAASHLLHPNEQTPDDLEWQKKVSGGGDGIGKIVLVGGEFSEARDDHRTPLGEMSGLELNAYAIESELHGGMITEVHPMIAFFSDLAAGTGFVALFWFVERRKRKMGWFFAATAITFVVVLLVSLILFELRWWLSFIPIWLGVNIHQYIEHGLSFIKE